MTFQEIIDVVQEHDGIPTEASLEAIGRIRADGSEPKLPAPLKVLLADARTRKVSYPEVSSEPLEYSALPTSNSIRLLQVHSEDDQGLLHCSLRVVELKRKPVYSCLSYTWGNPFPDLGLSRKATEERDYTTEWPIACNGKTKFVNQNLYDALKQIPRNSIFFERHGPTQMTVLHRAAANGVEALVFSSLISGSDCNSLDGSGKTPLHHAAENGHLTIVEALLEEGSDPTLEDFDGMTAFALARRNGRQDIADFLSNRIHPLQESAQGKIKVIGDMTFLWVDAICINQEDLAERTQQVLIMSRIYREARSVLAWLGPNDEFTEPACRTIRTIARQYQKYGDSDIVPYRDTEPEFYQKAGVPYISFKEWEALSFLYMRKWFSRAWILQEAILTEQFLMFCGSRQVIFDDLAVVTEALWKRGKETGFPSTSHMIKVVESPNGASSKRLGLSHDYLFAVEYHCYVLIRLKMRWIYDQAGMDNYVELDDRNASLSFTSLIHHAWGLDCKEPHDKVYSLLSLVKAGSSSLEVVPDYKVPIEELYARVTKEILKVEGSLNHLSNLNDRSVTKISSLPSWTPDYSVLGHATMHNMLYEAAGPQNGIEDFTLLHSPKWNVLTVRAFHIDTIDTLSAPNKGLNTQLYYDPSWWTLLSSLPNPYHRTGHSRSETLFRTLCMDTASSRSSSSSAQTSFQRLVMGMICAEAEKEDTIDAVRSASLMHILTTNFASAQEAQQDSSSETPGRSGQTVSSPAPSTGLDGPYFASIRSSLDTMDALARTEEPEQSFIPTLEDLDAFRASGEGRLWLSHRSNILNPEAITKWVQVAMDRLARRRLFVTKGGLLGLGSVSAREGDEVWVLEGASMPYVLRRKEGGKGGGWTLVAAAYVHGVMKGEAVEGKEGEWEILEIE